MVLKHRKKVIDNCVRVLGILLILMSAIVVMDGAFSLFNKSLIKWGWIVCIVLALVVLCLMLWGNRIEDCIYDRENQNQDMSE